MAFVCLEGGRNVSYGGRAAHVLLQTCPSRMRRWDRNLGQIGNRMTRIPWKAVIRCDRKSLRGKDKRLIGATHDPATSGRDPARGGWR